MKKRVILIIVLALLLGMAGLGGYWHHRRSQGSRLLIRAQVALRAEQPQKAIELVSRYLVQRPEDWRGHYCLGEARLRMGDLEEAQAAFTQAAHWAPDEFSPVQALANCAVQRGSQLLAKDSEVVSLAELEQGVAHLREGVAILRESAPTDPADQVERHERMGLYLERSSHGLNRLAAQLEDQADAAAGNVHDQRQALLDRAQQARAQAGEALDEAVVTLLAVVQAEPAREQAAQALIRLASQPGREQALETARAALLSAERKPPVATAMLVLNDLGHQRRQDSFTDRQAQLQSAAELLDELVAQAPDEAQVLLARANVALDLQDWATADRLADQVLELNARQGGARLVKALALLAQRRPAQAEEILFSLKTDFPQWPDAHYSFAQAALANGHEQIARDALRAVTVLEPGHPGASRHLAEYLLRHGFRAEALQDAQSYYQAHPADPQALRLYVRALTETDRRTRAQEVLAEARTRHAQNPEVLAAVMESYRYLGQTAEARQVAQAVLALTPASVGQSLALAQAAAFDGQTARAETILQGLLDAHGQQPVVLFAGARLYAQTGRLMQAVELAGRAVALAPQEEPLRLLLARLLLDTGQVAEALEQCRTILSANPSHAEAALLAEQARVLLGEPAEAVDLTAFGQAAPAGELALALTCLRAGRPAEAVELCRQQLRTDERNLNALALLAEAQLALKNDGGAIEAYHRAIATGQAPLPVYMRLVQVEARRRPVHEVAKSMHALPGAQSELVDLVIGQLRLQQGDSAGAVEAFQDARRASSAPQHVQNLARLLTAQALARGGKLAAALAELDSLAQGPWRTTALLAKVELLTAMDQAGQADTILAGLRQQAIADRDAHLLGRLVQTYVARRAYPQALAAGEALVQLSPDSAATYAGVLAAAGQLDPAVEWYGKAIAARPGDLTVRIRLAELLNTHGRFGEALEVLRDLEGHSYAGQAVSLYQQARLFAARGLQRKALVCIEDLDALGQAATPNLDYLRGRAFAALGRTDRALEILKAIPAHADVYRDAGLLRLELTADVDERLALLGELEAQRPDEIDLARWRLGLLMAEQRYEELLAAYAAYAERFDGPVLAELALQAQLALGDTDAAAAQADAVAAQTGQTPWRLRAELLQAAQPPAPPAQPDAWTDGPSLARDALAVALARLHGQADAARLRAERFSTAWAQLRPGQVSGGLRMSGIYVALAGGQLSGARAELDSAVDLPPAHRLAGRELLALAERQEAGSLEAAVALRALLAEEMALGRLSEALADQALTDRPGCQWAAATLVRVRPERAAEVLERLQPTDSPLARLIQADLAVVEGRFVQAADLYEGLSAGPTDWPMIRLRAVALERAGQLEQALALYEQVWAGSGDIASANNAAYLVSQLHADDTERLAQAESWVRQAMQIVPNLPAFQDTLGWLAHLRGRPDEAIDLLRLAIRGLPESPEVHYHLGIVEAELDNLELALWHLQAAVDYCHAAQAEGRPVESAELRAAEQARAALARLVEVAP